MQLIFQIIFFTSVFGLLHSYLLYPRLMTWLARNKTLSHPQYQRKDKLPKVFIVMSLYNEEKVIEQKLKTLLEQDYPSELIEIYIGSDWSTDTTNSKVSTIAKKHPQIKFFPFDQRQGKPGVINTLVRKIQTRATLNKNDVLLFTDANVMLKKDTVWKLIRHFKHPEIILVDANMINVGLLKEGISYAENQYISSEVLLKHREGLVFGKMAGPFGGCYALRANYYSFVPSNYLVDDFYIALKAFEKGGKAINDLEAICQESVSHDIKEEYRRKARISAGNFQNLKSFAYLLFPPYTKLSFTFISHKVLRWLGPFFIIFALISSGILGLRGNLFYQILFSCQLLLLVCIPLLDKLLVYFELHFIFIRNIHYFIIMNIALLDGFFKYLKGIKSNVWTPPKRT